MGEPCGMPRRLSRASVVRVIRPRSSVSSTGQSSDRVRLAGSGRSLNHEPLGLLEAPNDLDLVVVESLWEEQVALIRIDWLFDRQAPSVPCFDRVTDWLEGVIDPVAGPHDKRARSAFEHDGIHLVGSKLTLETFNIAENRIRGSPAREENVPVRHREVAALGCGAPAPTPEAS